MAEALGAAGSIAGIVSFGLQLATTLQTYIETMLEAEERLRDITFDINSTASALRQLQDIIDDDKTGSGVGKLSPKVFKDEGRREIEAIAQKCGKVYKTIVLLVNKAGNLDPKNAVHTASSDVVPLKISSLTRMMKWPWVEPHIKRCQEQLRWLKMSLLFNLQLASLARLQLGTRDRTTGEDELVIRKMVVFLRRNEINAAKALTQNPEKRQAVTSLSSLSSTSTAPTHIFPKTLVSQSPPEITLSPPPEKSMSNFSVQAYSSSPGVEGVSDTREMENSPNNTDNIFQLNMIQQTAPLHALNNFPPLNSFHQPDKTTRSLRRITTKISEEPEEPPGGDHNIAKEIPSELNEKPKQKPEVFRETTDNITESSGNLSIWSLNQEEISPQVIGGSSSSRENGLALATSIQQSRSTVSSMSRVKRLPSWLKEIFKPHRDSFDWESETLEAFVILDDSSDIIKVPFGDRGLRRLKKNLDVSWNKYASLESDQHQLVDKAILEAKLLDPRERICLGVGLYPRAEDQAIFIFFSLGDHVEPIYFTDFLGREFKFPFQIFRLWDKSNTWFTQLFQHMNEVGWYVSDGCYDILDDKGNILMPHTIKSSIEPGSRLGMRIWAKPEIDQGLLIAEKEAMQKSKVIATYLVKGEGKTEGKVQVIKLKDAFGRMYTFPFHVSKTWDGISALITQAFLNVEVYAPHVAGGHYDLLGPDNCRILPQLWEVTVQPGWSIVMCLWPQPEYPSNILLPWHVSPTPRRMLSSAPPPSDGRGPVPLSPILQSSGANIADFYNSSNNIRSEDEHTNFPDSYQESSRTLRNNSQKLNTSSRLSRDYHADQALPLPPRPILLKPVTDRRTEYPSQDPYRSEGSEGSAPASRRRRTSTHQNLVPSHGNSGTYNDIANDMQRMSIETAENAANARLAYRAPARSSVFEDKIREAAAYQDDVGGPGIPLNTDTANRQQTENYSMLKRPPVSSGNQQRYGENHSSLPSSRKRRADRVVVVDTPPTTRTPVQVYKQQFAASSSSIRSPGETIHPPDMTGFGGKQNTQPRESFLNNSHPQGADIGIAGAAIACSHPSETNGQPRERNSRPSIDPKYGDFLPLPPSEPGTPTNENPGELPYLPEIPPRPAQEISCTTQTYLQVPPRESPSQVAVPISFKRGNGNTSWDSMEELRPLYLLERRKSENREGEIDFEGDEESLPELPPSSPIASGGSPVAGTPQLAAARQQEPRTLTHEEASDRIGRRYYTAQSTTPEEKEQEKIRIMPSPIQLVEESISRPPISPQSSEDPWASGESVSEFNNIGGGTVSPVLTASSLSDEDLDLDLDLDIDVDVDMEDLSIGELLGRYTNATDTVIGMDEECMI